MINRGTIVLLIIAFVAASIIGILYATNRIDTAQTLEIAALTTLVLITAWYAKQTTIMAKEMREQRIMALRPAIVQKAVPFKTVGREFSDYFEIYNAGNGPAIELEILLLNKNKGLIKSQRETFFLRAGETPIYFHPSNLESHVKSTCYLLCQYRSIFSSGREQTWYQTELPFIPVKSQSGDKIIIQPKELEFRELTKKETF